MRRVWKLGLAAAWVSVALAAAPAAQALPVPPPGGGGPIIDNCVAIGLPVVPNAPGTCTGQDAQGNTFTGVKNDPATGGAIINYLRGWLILLNLAVAPVILLMLIVAGVQYITAAANPSLVKSAKSRLLNAIIALVMYLMMFAALQFLVPGGVL